MAPNDLGIGLLFWAVHEAVIVADAETERFVGFFSAAAGPAGGGAEAWPT